MTDFVKFPSIESFANVWHFMSRKMDPKPVHYGAKIKLHGTNGGVRVNADGTVVAQSRSRDLTAEDDNYGFAKWVERNVASFRVNPQIMQGLNGAADIEHVTYFGEWAGNGIQNKDAVTQLNQKFFFVFAIQINDEMHTDPELIESIAPDLDNLIVLPWFCVFDEPVGWIDVTKTNVFVEKLNVDVENIGVRDPFIFDTFGVDGPGEGLVITPMTRGYDGIDRDLYSALIFKAKTEAHRVKSSDKAVSPRVEIPPEANDFVSMFVTDARCEQALHEACDGIAEKPRTADFLKWLGGDVKKESVVELTESELDWKQVAPLVNKAAARWFLKRCEVLV